MPKRILMTQVHVSFLAPGGLPGPAYAAMRRVLNAKRFLADVREAVRALVRRHAALRPVRLVVA